MPLKTKEEWIDKYFEKFQDDAIETLLEVLDGIISVYEQNERGKSVATKQVLDSGMECTRGLIDRINDYRDIKGDATFNMYLKRQGELLEINEEL